MDRTKIKVLFTLREYQNLIRCNFENIRSYPITKKDIEEYIQFVKDTKDLHEKRMLQNNFR